MPDDAFHEHDGRSNDAQSHNGHPKNALKRTFGHDIA